MFYRVVKRENGAETQMSGCTNKSGVYKSLASAKNARAQLLSGYSWYYGRSTATARGDRPTRHTVVQKLYADGIDHFVWIDMDVKID